MCNTRWCKFGIHNIEIWFVSLKSLMIFFFIFKPPLWFTPSPLTDVSWNLPLMIIILCMHDIHLLPFLNKFNKYVFQSNESKANYWGNWQRHWVICRNANVKINPRGHVKSWIGWFSLSDSSKIKHHLIGVTLKVILKHLTFPFLVIFTEISSFY